MQKSLQLSIATLLFSGLSIICSDNVGALQLYNEGATRIDHKNIFSSVALGQIALYHTHKNREFIIEKESNVKKVQKHFIDKVLRDIKPEDLQRLLKANAYLKVGMNQQGDYTLRADGRISGGGPFLAGGIYCLVKAVGYSLPVVAVKLGFSALTDGKTMGGSAGVMGAVGAFGAYGINEEIAGSLTQKVTQKALEQGFSVGVQKGMVLGSGFLSGAIADKIVESVGPVVIDEATKQALGITVAQGIATVGAPAVPGIVTGLVGAYTGFVDSLATTLSGWAALLPGW